MIYEKLKNCEEKKTFIEKNLKIIFLAVFVLLVFPSLISASCGAKCMQGGACDEGLHVDECNYGVTPGCCGCFRQYYVFNATDVGGICKAGESCFAMITDKVWYKSHKFPNTGDYNGRPCAAFSSSSIFEYNCSQNGKGVWDASERKCIQCNGKLENKICGSAGTVSIETCKDTNSDGILDYCISLGCSQAGNGKCETACDAAGVSPKCDDKSEGEGCGTGGICDANCQCIGEVLPCGNKSCDVAGGECSSCPADCTVTDCCGNRVCNSAVGENSTNCLGDCPPCEPTCTCVCPDECPCGSGTCPPELRGGLVPCGKNCDDPCTKSCECCPCTLCHLFVLFKRIVDFLTLNIIFPLAVLMIVVGGVMFLTAGGDPGRIGGAKKILTATVIGLAIILAAWLIVDTVITFLTPASSPFQNWSTIDCPLCGDGNCDSGETKANCPADCAPPPPPVCSPDGCNGNCPAGCTVAQDPDCGCQNGNACCGIGCNNANDSDCPAVCTPTIPLCNGVCPAGCTVAQDPDCGCLSGNSCCGIGCNNANDSDCPVSACGCLCNDCPGVVSPCP